MALHRPAAFCRCRAGLIRVKAVLCARGETRRMMSFSEFLLGALVLLTTPGPTNTLLAASGAACGIRRSLVLLGGEILGYLTAIAVLTLAVGPLIARHAALGTALRAALCLYVLLLAWRLWTQGSGAPADACAITARRVLVTTLLNPKAAVMAFVLLPISSSAALVDAFSPLAALMDSLPRLATLSVLIVAVGGSWIAAGAFAGRGMGSPQAGYRAGAIALVAVAAVLGGSAVGLAHG